MATKKVRILHRGRIPFLGAYGPVLHPISLDEKVIDTLKKILGNDMIEEIQEAEAAPAQIVEEAVEAPAAAEEVAAEVEPEQANEPEVEAEAEQAEEPEVEEVDESEIELELEVEEDEEEEAEPVRKVPAHLMPKKKKKNG